METKKSGEWVNMQKRKKKVKTEKAKGVLARRISVEKVSNGRKTVAEGNTEQNIFFSGISKLNKT